MIVKVPNNIEPNVNVPVARRGQTGDNGACNRVASAVHHGRPVRLRLRPKGFAMSNTTISKGGLSATISSKGAELTSLKLDGREYLWQADSAFWGKHAPVLFPIVGSLRGDEPRAPGRMPHASPTVSPASTSTASPGWPRTARGDLRVHQLARDARGVSVRVQAQHDLRHHGRGDAHPDLLRHQHGCRRHALLRGRSPCVQRPRHPAPRTRRSRIT